MMLLISVICVANLVIGTEGIETLGFIPKKIQWHIHTGWWSLVN